MSIRLSFCGVLIIALIAVSGNLRVSAEATVDATAPYDNTNIFARILRKEAPADVVFENDHALAFRDIYPRAKVHVLVIPKGPYSNFGNFVDHASAEEQLAISATSKKIGVSDSGFRLLSNTGHHGGQTVPHLHFHILGGEPVPGLALKAEK